MKDDTKARLNAALKRYDQRKEQATARATERESQLKAFDAEFARVVRSVIRPIMEEFGLAIKQNGHDIAIDESRGVAMKVYPRGIDRHEFGNSSTPHVGFYVDRNEMKVHVHRSTMLPRLGGMSGSVGEYQVNQITADLVEITVLDLLEHVIGGKS